MSARRRTPAAALLAALALAGCGPGEPSPTAPPPLPFGKVPPSLPRMHRQRTLETWLEEVRSGDAPRRAAALYALGELLPDPAALRPVLAPRLRDADPHVRYAAVVVAGRSAGDLGPEVATLVVAQLAAGEPGTVRAARAAVARWGERAAPALAAALSATDPRLALQALRVLADLGPAGAGACPAVLTLLGAAPDLTAPALRALEAFGPAALDPLAQRLPAAPDEEAVLLLGVLARLGPALAPQAPALLAALGREEAVRRAAGEALLEGGAALLPALEAHAASPAPTAAQARALVERLRAR